MKMEKIGNGETNVVATRFDSDESLRERVNSAKSLEALTQLEQLLHSEEAVEIDKVIDKFFDEGGNASDLLNPLNSEVKVKSADVVTIFSALGSLLNYLSRKAVESTEEADVKKYQLLATEISRCVLGDHIRYIMILLSPTNTAHQVRTCLSMVTAMVICNARAAKDVLMKLDFSHASFESLNIRQTSIEIREAYCRFLMSFLAHSGSPGIMRMYLEKCRAKIATIFARLCNDSSDLVIYIVSTLRENLVLNPNISKTEKMKLFSVTNLKMISNVCTRWKPDEQLKLDPDDEAVLIDNVRREVSGLLIALLTSHKLGVVFHDVTCGTSGQNQNHLLQNLLRSMERQWENKHLAQIIVKALAANPDQMKPYFQKSLQPLWQPRETTTWLEISNLLISIFESVDLSQSISEVAKKTNFHKLAATMVKNIFCQEAVFKEVITPCLENSQLAINQRLGMKILRIILEKIQQTYEMKIFSKTDGLKRIMGGLTPRLPKIKLCIEFWELEVSRSSVDGLTITSNSLLDIAKVLFFYVHQSIAEPGRDFNVDTLLNDVQRLSVSGGEYEDVLDSTLLYLLKVLSYSPESDFKPEQLKVLAKVAGQCKNLENAQVAANTLQKILKLDAQSLDILRVWLHNIVPDNLEGLSGSIVDCLAGSTESNNVLDGYLFSFAQSNQLRKYKSYHRTCLQQSIVVHDNPQSVCIELSKIRLLEKACDLDTVIKSSRAETPFEDLNDLIEASRIFMSIRLGMLPEASLKQFLVSESKNKEIIAPKLLIRKSLLDGFGPLGKENRVALDLLGLARDDNLSLSYSSQFFNQLEKMSGRDRSSVSLDVLDRVFAELPISNNQVVDLLGTLRKDHEKFGVSDYLTQTLAHIISAHDKNFMSSLTGSENAGFLSNILTVILQQDHLSSCHQNLLTSCASHFELNPSLVSSLFKQDFLQVLFSSPSFHSKSRFLQCVAATDNDRAKGLIEWMKKNPEIISLHLGDFIAALADVLDQEKVEAKRLKPVVDHVIDNIMTMQDPDALTKANLSKVTKIVEIFEMRKFDLARFSQESNPIRLKVLSDIAIQRKSVEFVSNCLLRCMEGLPGPLKQLSLNPDDPGLLEKVSLFCEAAEKCSSVLEPGDLKGNVLTHEDGVWLTFVRSCLKYGLKMKIHVCLSVLSKIVTKVYDKSHSKEIGQIYDLITGHSSFLDSLLSTSSKKADVFIKKSVLELVYSLLKCKGSIVSSDHLPLFLGAYNATLSPNDMILLRIIYMHDFKFESGVPLQAYKPLLWGESALSKYAHKTAGPKAPHLSSVPKISEVLGLIDLNKMTETAMNFPLQLSLDLSNEDDLSTEDMNPSLYDPRFFLNLFAQICSAESYVDKHLKLVESGLLGLALASLSSFDLLTRNVGATVLARIYFQLEGAKKSLSAEKQVWIHLISLVRHGIANSLRDKKTPTEAIKDPNDLDNDDYDEDDDSQMVEEIEEEKLPEKEDVEIPRIPCILSAFLVRACFILFNPLDPMYKSISNFVLAKPALSIYSIPEFLRLFHSSDPVQHNTEREWIVTLLRDGVRDVLSYSLMQQAFIFKMILAFHDSPLPLFTTEDGPNDLLDEVPRTKIVIQEVIRNVVKIKRAAFDLVRNRGLLLWILIQTSGTGKLSYVLVDIMCQAWKAVSSANKVDYGRAEKPLPSSMLIQFFQTCVRVLQSLPKCAEPHQMLDFARSLLTVLVEVTLYAKSCPGMALQISPAIVANLNDVVRPLLTNVARVEKSKEVFRLLQRFTVLC